MSLIALLMGIGILMVVLRIVNDEGRDTRFQPPVATGLQKPSWEWTEADWAAARALVYDGNEAEWQAYFEGEEDEEDEGPDEEAVIHDIMSALRSLGWNATDSRALATEAVNDLGPETSLEDLTIRALSGKKP
jgi:hypothetical protein